MRYRQKNNHAVKVEAFRMPCSGEIRFDGPMASARFATGTYVVWTADHNPPTPVLYPSGAFERDFEPEMDHLHEMAFGYYGQPEPPRETHIHVANDAESDITITIRRREPTIAMSGDLSFDAVMESQRAVLREARKHTGEPS